MEPVFFQLALILFAAFVISYIIRIFNQPIIIGYIIAGILLGPFIFKSASIEMIHFFSELGIAFLLFIVGLHLNPKVIREIGGSSLIVGIFQIFFTFCIGFLIGYLLKFDIISSFYIGVALSFSSTIIIMKLLSDQSQLDSLFGKISIGILIVQDLVAVGLLMFISSMKDSVSFYNLALSGLIEGLGLILFLFLTGMFILPKLTQSIAKNQELLFLFSISWAFLISALFAWRGFSIEIGALVAGVVLSISPYATEISSKIRPLRDFFLIIFFIILGSGIQVSNINSIITNAVIFSLIALIIKPLIIMSLMAMGGYTKRTNFLTGTTLAQISEFSIIILALGLSLNHISSELVSTITLTLLITTTLSTYMIIYSNQFYRKMMGFLVLFEKKNIKEKRKIAKKYDVILFGYNRIGYNILRAIRRIKKKYLIVDFNPDTINNLNKLRIPALYGDVYDPDLLDELPLNKVELVVSTVPDFETNVLLVDTVKGINPKAIVILRAHSVKDALDLYKKGADYVLTPHFLGGEYLANMISKLKTNNKKYTPEKQKHLKMLEEILEKGLQNNHQK